MNTLSFLSQVAKQIIVDHPNDLHNVLVLLPSKRGELFLKRAIGSNLATPALAPAMQTIEEFVQDASGYQKQNQLQLLILLYGVYKEAINQSEPFDGFLKWANTLLYDFNEIDRHLVDAHQLFANLLDAKTIESWGVEAGNETHLMSSFLAFWKNLNPLYNAFKAKLDELGVGYQGMAYRKVAEDFQIIDDQLSGKYSSIYLLGFNALNKAEELIFQHLIKEHSAKVFWDTDLFYLEDEMHEAGHFIRQYQKNWPALSHQPFNWAQTNITRQPKKIKTISAASGLGMAKAAAQVLNELPTEDQISTAVVLADEALLLPMLDSIPDQYDAINITMGFPLKHSPLAQDLLNILKLHEQAERLNESGSSYSFHHKRFLAVIESALFRAISSKAAEKIVHQLTQQNQAYISAKSAQGLLAGYLPENEEWLKAFAKPENNIDLLEVLENILLKHVENHAENRGVYKQSAFVLHQTHRQLLDLLKPLNYKLEVRTLVRLYQSMMNEHQIDFYGEPLAGLQVMGMLETRTLDFKRVIITSMNEGILPAGKSQNTYIPFDLKKHFGLPTHHEKDAIYAYHFYRLIQRAEEVYLIYSSDMQGLGAKEKSRFISQIENEFAVLPNIEISPTKHNTPLVKPESLVTIPSFDKDDEVLGRLKEMAEYGFSPSALAIYIKDPTMFFVERVLGVNDPEEIAESIGHDVLGTVVHDALEELYKPLVNKALNAEEVKLQMKKSKTCVLEKLEKHYRGNLKEGRNLLIKNVAHHMVQQTLTQEVSRLKVLREKNQVLTIEFLEQSLEETVSIPGLSFTVKFKGIADRIERNGQEVTIVDYKTGAVNPSDVACAELDQLFENDKKGKAFQVLFYAWLYSKKFGVPKGGLKAGIFSTRNPSNGLMCFGLGSGKAKNESIGSDILAEFEKRLFGLIVELFEATKSFSPRFITLEEEEN